MDLGDVAAAVFFGNALTAAFLWACRAAMQYQKWSEVPKWVYAGMLFPIGFFLLSLASTGSLPLFLAASAHQ